MSQEREIAEAEARKLFAWYYAETKRITEKYKGVPGLDTGASECKKITKEFHEKLQALKKKYHIDCRECCDNG